MVSQIPALEHLTLIVCTVPYISALDHVRKLRISNIVFLTSINNLFNLVMLDFVQGRKGLYFQQARVSIIGKYVLLGVINTIYIKNIVTLE